MVDIAIVALERQRLGGVEPPLIPFATAGSPISEPQQVSVGCSLGSWPTCWKGHRVASSLFGGSVIQFVPAPADGRSGSALFDAAGKHVVGLVAWRDESQGVGLAMSHDVVWEFLRGRVPTNLNQPIDHAVPVQEQQYDFSLGDTPQACPQCEGLRLWPFGGKQQAPPTQPPTNPQNPWPDLPSTLGGSGAAPTGDLVLRSEFEAARREFDAALRDLDRRLNTQSGELENVDEQVAEQNASLRDKFREIATSETVQQEVAALKDEFLKRLQESEDSEKSVRERLKESLLGAVHDRIEQIKAELANRDGSGGTPLGGILSLALATVLPMLGLGGLQTWLVTRAVSRLTNRLRGQENESLLSELRNLVARARGNTSEN
jgi:hypothetical protein